MTFILQETFFTNEQEGGPLKDAFPETSLRKNTNSKMEKPLSILNDVSIVTSLKEIFAPHKQEQLSGKASFRGSPKLKGSMAVEAALAIPIFIFAILTVYVYFTALSTHTKLVMEQREKGKKICIYANLYESFLGVGDTVSLTESRQVSPISPTLLISEYRVWATFYAHAWTGYDISGNSGAAEEEEYVYITPEGSVYHKDIKCYHLRLSIKSTTKEEVGDLRNSDGGKYQKCEFCGRRAYNGTFYVTDSGDCYHTTLGCPGLKRTIETIPISKVGNRTPCSRCGG